MHRLSILFSHLTVCLHVSEIALWISFLGSARIPCVHNVVCVLYLLFMGSARLPFKVSSVQRFISRTRGEDWLFQLSTCCAHPSSFDIAAGTYEDSHFLHKRDNFFLGQRP